MPAECFDPVFDDGYYDENMYGLGFFAAIVIASDNVNLFLNSHTLEQSPGHALMQRFYANIEIGSAPFIAGAGPAMFVGDDDTFQGCTNVSIFGPGILGLASHHGTLRM